MKEPKDKLERLKDWVVNNSHLMKYQIIGTEKSNVKSSVFVNSTSLIGRIEQLQRGCCEHDYKLTTFEQNKKDSKITTKLVFTCKTCKETHEYKTDKLLWEETNKSKRYLKEQAEFYKPLYFQEQQIINSRIQELSSQLKDQRDNERLIAIYRPIVKNAKCLALNELRELQMDILENPRTKIMDLIDKRKFQLEEEIANWRE